MKRTNAMVLGCCLWAGVATAGTYQITTTPEDDATLARMLAQENADRPGKGEPPLANVQAFLDWYIGTRLRSFEANTLRQEAEDVKRAYFLLSGPEREQVKAITHKPQNP